MVERESFAARSTSVDFSPSHACNSCLSNLYIGSNPPLKVSWFPSTVFAEGDETEASVKTCLTQEETDKENQYMPGLLSFAIEDWKRQKKVLLEIVKGKDGQIYEEMERRGDRIPAFVENKVDVTRDVMFDFIKEYYNEAKEPSYMRIEKQMWFQLRAGILKAIELEDQDLIEFRDSFRARNETLSYERQDGQDSKRTQRKFKNKPRRLRE